MREISKYQIDDFIKELRDKSINNISEETDLDAKRCFSEHFIIKCKKCGSEKIFISWENGTDYGGYTGYSSGQKLFKCLDCGCAYSIWS
jgi:hypothetical protein